MSFFLSLVVGSLGIVLYVLVSLSRAAALSVYCCLSMMTMATPLSTVNTTLYWSSLISLMALNSSLMILGLVGALLLEQSTGLNPEFLNFPWGQFVHASSMAVMYVSLGGCLGAMAKLGPLDKSENYTGVRGLEDKLMTHLLLEFVTGLLFMGLGVELLVVVVVGLLVADSLVFVVLVVVSPPPLLFAGRTTLAILSSIEFNGEHLCEFGC